jgi:molybdopterin-guanine dinucleotide biosynthesis protein A
MPVLLGGEGVLRLVIDRLKTRFVPVRDEQAFANVNTPADYAKLRETMV